MKTVRRGDIYYADLSPSIGSEQGGIRPVLIIQNDVGNFYSPTVIVTVLTSKLKHQLPTHINVPMGNGNLIVNSTILLEQIRTIDKMRLQKYIGNVSKEIMDKVDCAMSVSLGLKKQK